MLSIEEELTKLLNQSAKKLNLQNYSINLDLTANKGDGFMGELYKVSLIDEDTKEEIKIVIKKALSGHQEKEGGSMEALYKNEIQFYTVIYPELHSFETEHQISEPFTSLPEYITGLSDLGHEVVVLKDITEKGFEMREKHLLLDDDHAKFIFKTYGRFHAISFCLKEQKPEKFNEIVEPLIGTWARNCESNEFIYFFKTIAQEAFESLDPDVDGLVVEKFRPYIEDFKDIFVTALSYRGDYACICHGDCWSNNMMFKYQDATRKIIEDINLLDFQLVSHGTPVYDLSYFFYVGGSKDLFDKLEEYLDIYYENFTTAVKNFGSDPEKLLPRHALSEDWKKYSKFGLIIAMLIHKLKLISKEDAADLVEKSNGEDKDDSTWFHLKYDKTLFNKRMRDILLHMYEINAL